jgi:hypothetical protein
MNDVNTPSSFHFLDELVLEWLSYGYLSDGYLSYYLIVA